MPPPICSSIAARTSSSTSSSQPISWTTISGLMPSLSATLL